MKGKIEDYLFAKPQPSAIPLEEAVLGGCLLDKDAYFIVRDILEPRKFYSDSHRLIMTAFDRLSNKGTPIDLLTATEELKSMGKLEEVGGGYYLVELTNRVASSANIEHHSRIVAQKWIQRELIKLSYNTIKNCFDDEDVFDSLKRIDAGLMDVTDVKRAGEMSLHDAVKEMHRLAMLMRDRGGDMVGLPLTGLQELDRMISGREPGDLIMVAASPGGGKSSLITNMLDCCLDTKARMYFWSNEAPMDRMAARVVSMRSRVPTRDIQMGKYLDDPNNPVFAVSDEMVGSGIKVINGEMDIHTMKRIVTMEKRMHGTDLFVFDRTELFSEFKKARGTGDKAMAVGDITAEMRSTANGLGVTIVTLSEFKAEAKGKRPHMSYVWGGTITHGNCTKMIGMWRPGLDGDPLPSGLVTKEAGEIVVIKNNYDPEGGIEMGFDGPCQCWRSLVGDIPKINDGNPF